MGVGSLFIKNCLTPVHELTLVYETDSVEAALTKMGSNLSLPCVDDAGNFAGIVSKRSIFESFEKGFPDINFTAFLEHPVAHSIVRDAHTLTVKDHFEDTIEIITRIPFVPIVQDGKLIGIVKRSDIQNALSVAFATRVDADRLLLGVPEVEGTFERMFNMTHRLGLSVVTCIPFDAGENLNRRVILKVTKSDKLPQLVTQLERAGILVLEVN